jgi:hypothetical protein
MIIFACEAIQCRVSPLPMVRAEVTDAFQESGAIMSFLPHLGVCGRYACIATTHPLATTHPFCGRYACIATPHPCQVHSRAGEVPTSRMPDCGACIYCIAHDHCRSNSHTCLGRCCCNTSCGTDSEEIWVTTSMKSA